MSDSDAVACNKLGIKFLGGTREIPDALEVKNLRLKKGNPKKGSYRLDGGRPIEFTLDAGCTFKFDVGLEVNEVEITLDKDVATVECTGGGIQAIQLGKIKALVTA